nr:unnamed protein product [Callosobruchus chinensis]
MISQVLIGMKFSM